MAALEINSAITFSLWSRIVGMSLEGFSLDENESTRRRCLLIKGSVAIMYGARDMINVAFFQGGRRTAL
jgi:hypothetical protein